MFNILNRQALWSLSFNRRSIYFNLVKKSLFDSSKILVTVQGCGAFVVFQMDSHVNGFS